jgi:hypothetical protein
MQSKATTVAEYLAGLPADRRSLIETVHQFFCKHLDPDFEARISYGMIGYAVPHRIYPAGYHCDPKQPLPFAGLAAQKNHCSLYLMSAYANDDNEGGRWFREAWTKAGKKLDMGKCCIRFKRLDDLALDVLATALKKWTVKSYVASYEETVGKLRSAKASSKTKTKPATATKRNGTTTKAATRTASPTKQSAAKKATKRTAKKTTKRTQAG